MTSQINPTSIDGNYPIPGVSNNTQGMRDNFTATKTNFQYAEDEINDLQSKSIFKAALTGSTLDNNMANNLIYNARVQGFSGTLVQIANTSGAISVDCSAGHYQTIVMAGNISISFTTATWPIAGTVGLIRLQITVDQAGRTMTLPAQVSLGTTGIQGYSANVITFAAAGVYEFGFLTYDQGTTITLFDMNRPLNYYTNTVTIAANTVSTSTTSGALIVSGGVGIGGNLYVNGDIYGNVTLTDIDVSTVTAVGNIVGGNVLSGAAITATGNVNGGNIITTALVKGATVSATANVIGGNINTAGLISATGNITGGNVLGGANVNATLFTGTTISVTGNITGGNVLFNSGLISGAGNITGGNIISSAVISAVGNSAVLTATAIPAGGTAGAGYKFSSTANFGVFFGSGAPTLAAAKGSLYLRSDGTTTNDRMYVNTNGSTTWTAVITQA